MENGNSPQGLHKLEALLGSAARPIWQAGWNTLGPHLRRWWNNPLLYHARREKPLPGPLVGRGLPATAAIVALLSILVWAINWRPLGAALIGLSLGIVLAMMLVTPLMSADRVARLMRFPTQDPRRLTSLSERDVVWGLALVTLWRLRWLILAGLALTPALVIGLLRVDVANFAAWQSSVQALGAAASAGQSGWLLPGGEIPAFRLVLRALSAGLIPWVMLPLLASLGVTAALALHDASLSPLTGLLGGTLLAGMILSIWEGLARTTLLAGGLEVFRLLLLIALLVGIGAATAWVNGQNGTLLVRARNEREAARDGSITDD